MHVKKIEIHDRGCPVDPPTPAKLPATEEITDPQALLDAAKEEESKKTKKQ